MVPKTKKAERLVQKGFGMSKIFMITIVFEKVHIHVKTVRK